MYCLLVSVILVCVLRSVGVFLHVKSNFMVFKSSRDGSPRSAGSS